MGLLFQGDTCRLGSLTASADEEVEFSRFGYMVQVVVVEAQQFRGNLERDRLAFACAKEYFLEAFQFAYRTGDAPHKVADVQLHYFRTVALSGIGDGDHGGDRTVLLH